ncbi:50S ribosomal protein L3 [bacterium]|nr:50S ribosomal protein L3 [bacterium]|tara:strand:- start:591 stop:1145 length:555 start_codon:yes stop_codon:yes gene_type:complete
MTKVAAKKVGMTQIWKEDAVIPVTVLRIEKEGEKELKEGDIVHIRGKSKGKGFQGVVKRHGFHGGPASHGQKHSLRAPGSIGATDPARVIPGQKMAGRMGGENLTVKNVCVEEINFEEKTILVKGPVPGMRGSEVEIHITGLKEEKKEKAETSEPSKKKQEKEEKKKEADNKANEALPAQADKS